MPRQRRNPPNTINNHGSKEAQKENKTAPVSKLEHMKICDINGRGFKIAFLKILNDV